MIKEYFKDWNKFELIFLISGISISILSSIIFGGTIINTLYTSLSFITALLTSKGKIECYFVGFGYTCFYAIVSFNQRYYGELILTIFLTIPMMIFGIISWFKNQDKEEDVVIINSLSRKEISIVFGLQVMLFWGYYFLLKAFNTELLIVSTISIVTSVLASYLEARRSEISLFCYIANDLVLITLWVIPVIGGEKALISVLVGPILLLINDIYGSYNWKKLKKVQKEKQLEKV